jgi:hypothetical protein
MPSAAAKRYWDYLPNVCVCGATSECVHHIIHVNGQRITKDDMLVVKLCSDCHQYGKQAVHRLGGERQFLEATGWNLVELAALRRHDWEVRHG